jgi:CBS domain-containing protein
MSIVRDVLNRKGFETFTVTKTTTVLDAARMMNQCRCGAMCVVENDALVGMFTERDILNRVVAQQLDPAATEVGAVMSAPVVSCGPDADAGDCAAVMSARKIRHLPVVEGGQGSGKLIGLISTGDLMALKVDEKQAQIEHLHEYLHGRA